MEDQNNDDIKFLKELTLMREENLNTSVFERLLKIDDVVKEDFIKLTNGEVRILLILSLNFWAKRKYTKYLDSTSIEIVLMDLPSENLILNAIPYLKGEYKKFIYAKELKEDCSIKESLIYINESKFQMQLIRNIKNPDVYIAVFKQLQYTDYQKYLVLKSIKDIDLKQELAKKIYKLRDSVYEELKKRNYQIETYKDDLPKSLTFGIELEYFGSKAQGLLIHDKKLLGYDLKEESTISYDAIEFSSPILSWNKESLCSIYQICNFVKANDLKVDERCGGHIHFSSDFLDSYDAWNWFMYLYSKFEFILFLTTNREEDIPRRNVVRYANPFSRSYVNNLWQTNYIKTKDGFIHFLKDISGNKTSAINFYNIDVNFNTIEFRMPNGSLDARLIIDNILLIGSLFVLAKKLSKLPLTQDLHTLLYELDNITDYSRTMDIMLKLLFKDDDTKKRFKRRFLINYKRIRKENLGMYLSESSKPYSFQKTGIKI